MIQLPKPVGSVIVLRIGGDRRVLVKVSEDRWRDVAFGIMRDNRQVFRWVRFYGAPIEVFVPEVVSTPDATRFGPLIEEMRALAADMCDIIFAPTREYAASELGGFADRLEELILGGAE